MSKKGKMIHLKERQVVHNVLRFFELEAANDRLTIPIQQAQKRTAAATGVSLRTIQRIKKESTISLNLLSPDRHRGPIKNRNILFTVDDFDCCAIRQTVNEFRAKHKKPSCANLLPAIKERINFPWRRESLRKILHKIGFRWKRCQDNRMVLIETQDIVQWRYRFLHQMKKHRESKRQIIYLNETWIDDDLCFAKCWQIDKIRAFIKRNTKNKLILMNACNQNGFIEGTSLEFQPSISSENHNEQMNFEIFSIWLKEKVMPNIPTNCVICMDSASYHTKVLNPKPSKYATKEELCQWLEENQIPYSIQMRKTELYDLVTTNAPPTKKFCIDDLLKEKCHEVLKIPPYHSNLNPIELAWSMTKRFVEEKKVISEINIKTLKDLIFETLSSITKEHWINYYNQVINTENNYWELDNLVEKTIEEEIFMVGGDGDSSEDNSESSETAESDFVESYCNKT